MLPELLDQIPPEQQVGSVCADGAFDTQVPLTPSPRVPPRSSAEEERQTMEAGHPGAVARNGSCASKRVGQSGDDGRVSPPKPCRDQDALCGSGRLSIRDSTVRLQVPGQGRRAQRLHRSHAHHGSHRISLSGEGTSVNSRFVQQSLVPTKNYSFQRTPSCEAISPPLLFVTCEWQVRVDDFDGADEFGCRPDASAGS